MQRRELLSIAAGVVALTTVWSGRSSDGDDPAGDPDRSPDRQDTSDDPTVRIDVVLRSNE